MPKVSIREEVCELVVAAMVNIETGTGFDHTMRAVYRAYKNPRQMRAFPYCCVLDGRGRNTIASESPEGNLNFYGVPLEFQIVGFNTVGKPDDDDYNPSTRMNNLIADIQRGVLIAPDLKGGGTNPVCRTLLRSERHEVWVEQRPVGVAIVDIEVQYEFRDDVDETVGAEIDGPYEGRS